MVSIQESFVLSLVLGVLFCSCYVDRPWPWREEPKPWDSKSVARTYRVRARETDGKEITLFRAAIVEDEGRQFLVGRVWDPRGDSESTAKLDLSEVDRLETQRMRTELVGASASHVVGVCCTVLAVVLIVSWF